MQHSCSDPVRRAHPNKDRFLKPFIGKIKARKVRPQTDTLFALDI